MTISRIFCLSFSWLSVPYWQVPRLPKYVIAFCRFDLSAVAYFSVHHYDLLFLLQIRSLDWFSLVLEFIRFPSCEFLHSPSLGHRECFHCFAMATRLLWTFLCDSWNIWAMFSLGSVSRSKPASLDAISINCTTHIFSSVNTVSLWAIAAPTDFFIPHPLDTVWFINLCIL